MVLVGLFFEQKSAGVHGDMELWRKSNRVIFIMLEKNIILVVFLWHMCFHCIMKDTFRERMDEKMKRPRICGLSLLFYKFCFYSVFREKFYNGLEILLVIYEIDKAMSRTGNCNQLFG